MLMRFIAIICLLLLPLQSIADAYYASFKNAGQVSEAGNDLVLYFDNNKVWGKLRLYSNSYDNVYVSLYGDGYALDSRLALKAVASSEGTTYEVGDFRIDFQGTDNQKLVINGPILADPLALSRQKEVISMMKHLGPLETKQGIINGVSRFINKESNVAGAIFAQLPKANIGNTRKVSLFNFNYGQINQSLLRLFKKLSKAKDSELFKRFQTDPAFAVIYGFKQTGLLPDAKQVYAYKNEQGKVGYTWKTCPDSFNVEDDEQGLCQTFHFYHAKHLDILPVLVEVESHRTCMDDSCHHDYFEIYLSRGITYGWKVTSQRTAQRCDPFRGGGSPPCL